MDKAAELAALAAVTAAQGLARFCIFEADAPVHVSAPFAAAFGMTPEDGHGWLRCLDAGGVSLVRSALSAAADAPQRLTFDALRADGSAGRLAAGLVSVRAWRTEWVVFVILDGAEQERGMMRLQTLARGDALTGLANRDWLFEACRGLLDECRRKGGLAWLLLADIDGLAKLNAACGRAAGDEALLRTARCIERTMRDGDLVARAGGDQFAVAMVTTGRSADAALVAGRMIRSVSESGPKALAPPIGLTVGIACWPAHARDVDELFRAAAHAMRRAKRMGRHCYSFADETQDIAAEAGAAFLEWGKDRDLGIAGMDADHRTIAALINALGEELGQARDEERLAACMDRLVSFTSEHFAREEQWMDERGYAAAPAHKAEHTRLLEDVAALALRLDTRSLVLTMDYLREWLVRHVASADRELARARRRGYPLS